jgi:hypothetical protein
MQLEVLVSMFQQETLGSSVPGTTITAPSSVSSMGAIITYQDNAGTNALNTDINFMIMVQFNLYIYKSADLY